MGVCLVDHHHQMTNQDPVLKPSRQQTLTPPHVSRQVPSPLIMPSSILGKPFEDVKAHYTLCKELGRGSFGVIYSCVEKSTGRSYACKSIRKPTLRSDRDDLRREVKILQRLAGYPNIVEFKGAYEDLFYVHVVMELCTHGDLLDQIDRKGRCTEEEAAAMCRDIVTALHTCQSMGVIHRDLKLENLLLSKDGELKLADFGLSVFFGQGELRCDLVGSPNYVAPEVLASRYGKEIDIWSAGVILYILLSGDFPFDAESGEDEDVFNAIETGMLDFESAPWPTISSSAKDLIRKMLTKDPKQRITASQVLEHPWITGHGKASHK